MRLWVYANLTGEGRVRSRNGVAICCLGRYGLWSGRDARPNWTGMGKRLQDGWQACSAGTRCRDVKSL